MGCQLNGRWIVSHATSTSSTVFQLACKTIWHHLPWCLHSQEGHIGYIQIIKLRKLCSNTNNAGYLQL